MKSSIILSMIWMLLGCGTFDTQPQTVTKNDIEIRDVPFEVRDDIGMRKRVIVLPFIDSTGRNNERDAEMSRGVLVKTLNKTGQFIIISNSDFPKDVKSFMNNEEYDLHEIAKIASGMGISAVIEGKILDIQYRKLGDEVGVFRNSKARVDATVRLRVVNAANGKEVLNDTKKVTEEDSTTHIGADVHLNRNEPDPGLIKMAILRAFQDAPTKILRSVEKLTWQGRVALVDGDRIYLNAGRLSGLQIGDILKVTEEGEEVFDPETGFLIGKTPGRMKGTVEIISYFGKDGAISIVHSGSGFRENDLVELY